MPSIKIADGPFKGWRRWSQLDADSFQSLVGPVYFRAGADGSVECRSPTETKHRNNQGRLHGGYVTTFIDMALFAIAAPALTAHRAVTLTLNTEFLGAGVPGMDIYATGEITRETGKLIFLRGLVTQDGPIASFSGVLRKVAPR